MIDNTINKSDYIYTKFYLLFKEKAKKLNLDLFDTGYALSKGGIYTCVQITFIGKDDTHKISGQYYGHMLKAIRDTFGLRKSDIRKYYNKFDKNFQQDTIYCELEFAGRTIKYAMLKEKNGKN